MELFRSMRFSRTFARVSPSPSTERGRRVISRQNRVLTFVKKTVYILFFVFLRKWCYVQRSVKTITVNVLVDFSVKRYIFKVHFWNVANI